MKIQLKRKSIPGTLIISLIVLIPGVLSCNKKNIPAKSVAVKTEITGKDLQNYNYLLSEASKQKILGNLQKAIIYYQECIKINPASDAAYFELSQLYSLAGQYKESLYYGKKAAETDPDNLWYLLNLGNLYQAFNNIDSSLVVYEKIHKKFPERTDLFLHMGSLYTAAGKYNKALKIFNEIEQDYGKQPSISEIKVNIYENTGKSEKAEKELLYLINTYPGNSKYKMQLAEFLYANGRVNEAGSIYNKLSVSDLGDALRFSLIGYYQKKELYDSVFIQVDSILTSRYTNMQKKLQLLDSFINDPNAKMKNQELMKKSIDLFQKQHPEEFRINILRGDYNFNIGKYDNAVEAYKNYLKKEKNNYNIWQKLLYAENMEEDYETLVKDGKIAVTMFDNAPLLDLFYGIGAMRTGKNEIAAKVLENGLKIVKDERLKLQFYSLLGEVYRNLGKNRSSDEAFEKALGIDPNDQIVLNNYAYYLSLRESDLEKARKMSLKTIKNEPENSTYLDTYGWILYKMGNYQEAMKYLKQAVDSSENPSAEILEHYGDVLFKMKQIDEAVIYWNKALKKGGNSKNLNEKIQKARK